MIYPFRSDKSSFPVHIFETEHGKWVVHSRKLNVNTKFNDDIEKESPCKLFQIDLKIKLKKKKKMEV